MLPPGASVVFSVLRDHLENGRSIRIFYKYQKEGKKRDWKITVLTVGFISSLQTCLADSKVLERVFLQFKVCTRDFDP
jgi:hypothetical protein